MQNIHRQGQNHPASAKISLELNIVASDVRAEPAVLPLLSFRKNLMRLVKTELAEVGN